MFTVCIFIIVRILAVVFASSFHCQYPVFLRSKKNNFKFYYAMHHFRLVKFE